MAQASLFQLSRIYAQGWNAAHALTADVRNDMTAEGLAALNPHAAEPERTRWRDGFREAGGAHAGSRMPIRLQRDSLV